MGVYIDQRFYSELLERKSVKKHNKIYLLLFDTIWPQSRNFELFLSSSENSLKIEYAKKIYESFAFINDIFLPPFTILNVLNDQYHDLKEHSSGYIPQDHVIHSINTYILGIYLFFNSEKINKKIVKTIPNNNLYYSIKDFVLKWQLFALYHDVGYYFEDGDISKKNIEQYTSIFNDVLKCIISKHISKAVTFKALVEKYSTRFDLSCVEQNIGPWYDDNGNRISKSKIKESINKFVDATCIEAITSDEELSLLFPILENKEYLVVVYNEDGSCVSLIIRNGLNVKKFFSKSNSYSELFLNNILNTSTSKYVFQYFLLDIQTNAFWSQIIDEPIVINDIYSQLPHDLTSNISINNSSVLGILFDVHNWLSKKLTYNSSQEKAKHEENTNECLKESFLKICKEIIEQVIQEQNADNRLIEQTFDIISLTFKKEKKEAYSNILRHTQEIYRQHFAITHRFVEYCSEEFNELSQTPSVLGSIESLNVLATKDEEDLQFHPFVYNKKDQFHSALFSSIAKLSENLETSIEQLINYHSPYVEIDHGVFSSCLIFQIVCFLNDVKKYCLENSRLSLSWSPLLKDENYLLELTSKTIFSILIHNIYNKKSTPSYGVPYCHNIDADPFSYFCAFCDTLQKWGRPKKSNLSKTQLPYTNYLEDEFDIEISHENIIIRCIKSNIPKIVELVQSSELFLPGISILIDVKEF